MTRTAADNPRYEQFDAMVARDPTGFVGGAVTLYLYDRPARAHLRRDGNWQRVEDGALLDQNEVGLILPAGSLTAITEAIDEFRGVASHGATEARVLREWLTVERERVDRTLGR